VFQGNTQPKFTLLDLVAKKSGRKGHVYSPSGKHNWGSANRW